MEAPCDGHIVKLTKADMNGNLTDLNSKLLSIVCFEYLMNKTMVHKELLTPNAAASVKL